MKKLIVANMLFFMAFFCFGQSVDEVETNVDEMEAIESAEAEIFMEDFIGFHGKKYTGAMMDEGTTFMVSEKYLDKEIGVVEEFIEDYFENISTTRTFSCSWEKGTKLYKIKNIDENKYIAVEWIDKRLGNKYYVYCHQKDTNAEQQLLKFLKQK
jgi:hypothetical protein